MPSLTSSVTSTPWLRAPAATLIASDPITSAVPPTHGLMVGGTVGAGRGVGSMFVGGVFWEVRDPDLRGVNGLRNRHDRSISMKAARGRPANAGEKTWRLSRGVSSCWSARLSRSDWRCVFVTSCRVDDCLVILALGVTRLTLRRPAV